MPSYNPYIRIQGASFDSSAGSQLQSQAIKSLQNAFNVTGNTIEKVGSIQTKQRQNDAYKNGINVANTGDVKKMNEYITSSGSDLTAGDAQSLISSTRKNLLFGQQQDEVTRLKNERNANRSLAADDYRATDAGLTGFDKKLTNTSGTGAYDLANEEVSKNKNYHLLQSELDGIDSTEYSKLPSDKSTWTNAQKKVYDDYNETAKPISDKIGAIYDDALKKYIYKNNNADEFNSKLQSVYDNNFRTKEDLVNEITQAGAQNGADPLFTAKMAQIKANGLQTKKEVVAEEAAKTLALNKQIKDERDLNLKIQGLQIKAGKAQDAHNKKMSIKSKKGATLTRADIINKLHSLNLGGTFLNTHDNDKFLSTVDLAAVMLGKEVNGKVVPNYKKAYDYARNFVTYGNGVGTNNGFEPPEGDKLKASVESYASNNNRSYNGPSNVPNVDLKALAKYKPVQSKTYNELVADKRKASLNELNSLLGTTGGTSNKEKTVAPKGKGKKKIVTGVNGDDSTIAGNNKGNDNTGDNKDNTITSEDNKNNKDKVQTFLDTLNRKDVHRAESHGVFKVADTFSSFFGDGTVNHGSKEDIKQIDSIRHIKNALKRQSPAARKQNIKDSMNIQNSIEKTTKELDGAIEAKDNLIKYTKSKEYLMLPADEKKIVGAQLLKLNNRVNNYKNKKENQLNKFSKIQKIGNIIRRVNNNDFSDSNSIHSAEIITDNELTDRYGEIGKDGIRSKSGLNVAKNIATSFGKVGLFVGVPEGIAVKTIGKVSVSKYGTTFMNSFYKSMSKLPSKTIYGRIVGTEKEIDLAVSRSLVSTIRTERANGKIVTIKDVKKLKKLAESMAKGKKKLSKAMIQTEKNTKAEKILKLKEKNRIDKINKIDVDELSNKELTDLISSL